MCLQFRSSGHVKLSNSEHELSQDKEAAGTVAGLSLQRLGVPPGFHESGVAFLVVVQDCEGD